MPIAFPQARHPAVNVRAVTRGPLYHFFGYYDKSCWDASGRWILGQESSFMDRPPRAGDPLTIGMIDTHNDHAWRPLAQTRAWNWQQGCMLQWLGGGPEIIFNDVREGRFIARVMNVETGTERVLERPIYTVNRPGTHGVSLNFSRLQHQRPGYGYAGVPDAWEHVAVPEDDGLYAVDLQSGASRLILSVAQAAAFKPKAEFDGKIHRFNHAQFGADAGRFAFLHRYKSADEEVGLTRLMTLNLDGSELRCLSDHGLVSHYDWHGTSAILAWAHRKGIGDRYFLFQEDGNGIETVGDGIFFCDGHCSYSPDGKWILTDTYPDETHHRSLLLYQPQTGVLYLLGRFLAAPMNWEIRCDLHPRWNRDGTQICIDSIHEGPRQMYVLDVGHLTASA